LGAGGVICGIVRSSRSGVPVERLFRCLELLVFITLSASPLRCFFAGDAPFIPYFSIGNPD
jgi:hypothetical protein